jgi:predicted alpha/beta hydrolase family esterase
VVASTDDPYGSLEYVQNRAQQWNSRLVKIGAAGHINALSNLGEWLEGKSIMDDFVESLGLVEGANPSI